MLFSHIKKSFLKINYFIKIFCIMSVTDEQLRQAVDAVFAKYDTDNSQSLESTEVFNLINDALAHMKSGRQISQAEVDNFIKAVDSSGDNKIQKPELFEIFKKVLNSQ